MIKWLVSHRAMIPLSYWTVSARVAVLQWLAQFETVFLGLFEVFVEVPASPCKAVAMMDQGMCCHNPYDYNQGCCKSTGLSQPLLSALPSYKMPHLRLALLNPSHWLPPSQIKWWPVIQCRSRNLNPWLTSRIGHVRPNHFDEINPRFHFLKPNLKQRTRNH